MCGFGSMSAVLPLIKVSVEPQHFGCACIGSSAQATSLCLRMCMRRERDRTRSMSW